MDKTICGPNGQHGAVLVAKIFLCRASVLVLSTSYLVIRGAMLLYCGYLIIELTAASARSVNPQQ